jgi:hypothetical protein
MRRAVTNIEGRLLILPHQLGNMQILPFNTSANMLLTNETEQWTVDQVIKSVELAGFNAGNSKLPQLFGRFFVETKYE